ncbi:sulfotransferase [Pseudomonas sp. KFB-139]|uniref:Sulfotransferase n=1 Tax=Pseudomonas serbiensis TaxID=3064350 RepID=A0ABT9CQY1_9PSED|nr:sulfotransferase [Pseudomonas sp. KFB-138]MDO7927152.1 sulfotransferase [Pseudomonas sp. KFB-138]
MHDFHFISGLPRSGSTLLSAILLQNPRFHAGMSSPVASLFSNVLGQCSAGSEFASMIDINARRRLLRGIFESYYADKTDKSIVFDTNRGWSSRLPALMDLFPKSKVIACVRNVAWIMDSIERVYRNNPFENTKLFVDDSERNTVYSRVETLAQRNRLVGFAWASLKEAYYGENADSLLLIDYDLLAQAPERVMRLVYEFIGEPWFEHDFNNLSYDAPQFDDALGVSGLHKVKPRVAFESRHTILPPDLFEQYSKLSFWNDGSASAANVIRMKSDAATN